MSSQKVPCLCKSRSPAKTDVGEHVVKNDKKVVAHIWKLALIKSQCPWFGLNRSQQKLQFEMFYTFGFQMLSVLFFLAWARSHVQSAGKGRHHKHQWLGTGLEAQVSSRAGLHMQLPCATWEDGHSWGVMPSGIKLDLSASTWTQHRSWKMDEHGTWLPKTAMTWYDWGPIVQSTKRSTPGQYPGSRRDRRRRPLCFFPVLTVDLLGFRHSSAKLSELNMDQLWKLESTVVGKASGFQLPNSGCLQL